MTDANLAAARAQKTLHPGSGKCVLCGEDVWRFYTSGDTAHLTMFDELVGGSFDFPNQGEGVAQYVHDDGELKPHNCLEDTA